ncbi:MAG: GDP-mannose 4,6-dehydratase, partial [Candidatus Saelkia tenebricola]|nr:GDP-mannose 4,6-dehydratase [Candidatus Saelkia tenebricola]
MKTAVVAGGAGFLGSYLCEELLKKGFSVICVDNFITGDIANINHLIPDSNFKLIELDVS